jgi:CheY-like chemotaxis protein
MRKRILVVDDEQDIVALLAANVQAWGHDVVTASSATEARACCEDQVPDVLLLDVTMPDVDGPTLLRSLRDEGIAPHHFYLVSALPRSQLAELAAELGVGFVAKPFTAPTLRAALAPVI